MRTEFKIENGRIDPVELAEHIECIGTHYRLITDGEPIDLTSPFISAMVFTSVDVYSILVAVDAVAFKECNWKYVLHKADLPPVLDGTDSRQMKITPSDRIAFKEFNSRYQKSQLTG